MANAEAVCTGKALGVKSGNVHSAAVVERQLVEGVGDAVQVKDAQFDDGPSTVPGEKKSNRGGQGGEKWPLEQRASGGKMKFAQFGSTNVPTTPGKQLTIQ